MENKGSRTAQAKSLCIKQVIAIDDSLGRVRNHACETMSMSQTIMQYAQGIDQISFRHCPESFTRAFQVHRDAWLALIPVTDKYSELRGEMHELFKALETGSDADTFKLLVQDIWSTWYEVEKFVEK